MNALVEPSVVDALYAASQAGVQIDLIVRGMCALRPGVKGVSENIRVRSIVGRFLEHSRIVCFGNGGREEIYLRQRRLAARNLFERCEVVFPIKDADLRARLRDEILAAFLADTVKARLELSDGSYVYANHTPAGKAATPFDAQDFLMRLAEGKASAGDIPKVAPQRTPVVSRAATKTARSRTKRPARAEKRPEQQVVEA